MKTKIALFFVSLMFISALAVVTAQTPTHIGPYGNLRIGPYGNLKIGPYGNLVGLADTQGKDILSEIREGFAIAYEVKSPKGGNEARLVYALGDQLTSGLMVGKSIKGTRVVTTRDKALEVSRTLTWDEKSNTLKSHITVTNIGPGDVTLTGIELEIDDQLLGALIGEKPVKDLHLSSASSALAEHVRTWAGENCNGCPVPPCVDDRCNPGQAKAAFRNPNSSRLASADDLVASRLPHFSGSLLSLAWPGTNLVNPTLRGGEKISLISLLVRND